MSDKYIARVIDDNATFSVYEGSKQGSRGVRKWTACKIVIASTDRQALERCQNIVKVGKINQHKANNLGNRKPYYYLTFIQSDCMSVLVRVMPYLNNKVQQAKLMYFFLQTKGHSNIPPHVFKLAMHALNHSGEGSIPVDQVQALSLIQRHMMAMRI